MDREREREGEREREILCAKVFDSFAHWGRPPSPSSYMLSLHNLQIFVLTLSLKS